MENAVVMQREWYMFLCMTLNTFTEFTEIWWIKKTLWNEQKSLSDEISDGSKIMKWGANEPPFFKKGGLET